MLTAGIVGPVAALLACLVMAPALQFELYLWMAIVISLASWAMIVPSQLIEGRMEDHAPLRFFNLLAGALVGVAAWMIADSVYVSLPASNDFSPGPNDTLFHEMFGWNVDGIARRLQCRQRHRPADDVRRVLRLPVRRDAMVAVGGMDAAEPRQPLVDRVRRVHRLGAHVPVVVPAADRDAVSGGDRVHRAVVESLAVAKPAPGAGAEGGLRCNRLVQLKSPVGSCRSWPLLCSSCCFAFGVGLMSRMLLPQSSSSPAGWFFLLGHGDALA